VRSLWKRQNWVALLTVCVTLGTGHSTRGQSAAPNYTALKGEMRVFSAVIDESMAQTFAPPFGVLEKAKGTYLPGFGVVFALEVNLHPVPLQDLLLNRSPTKGELERELKTKQERIKTIKQTMSRLLAEHARSLREIRPEDHVAVVVHLFDVQGGAGELPTQLVVQVDKRDLDQYWEKKLSYEQFLGQVKFLEL
jgi:hypothetical protein